MIAAPYDANFSRSAITLPVVIESIVSGRSAVMGMFVDVLAPRSVIALSVVDELALTLFGEGDIIGSDDEIAAAPSYFATSWVGDRAYWTCALGYGDTSYVGRDILDQLSVALDGPNQLLLATAPT